MNRTDFQDIAQMRMDESRALLGLTPPRPSGAYYLAGYAVECALKTVITKQFGQHDWPDKKFVNDCHTHILADLVRLAGLNDELGKETAANPPFARNWQIVKDWSERSRYEKYPVAEAQELVDAVGDPANGVLPWIVARW